MLNYNDILESKSFREFANNLNKIKQEHEDKIQELERLSGRTLDELIEIYKFQVSNDRKRDDFDRGDILRLTHVISGKTTQGICVGYDGDFLWVIYNDSKIPVCLVKHYYNISNLHIHNAELISDLTTFC